MAKTFRVTSTTRVFNRLFGVPIRLGVAPKHFYLLAVRGRRSARLHSTPVRLVAVLRRDAGLAALGVHRRSRPSPRLQAGEPGVARGGLRPAGNKCLGTDVGMSR